jgi:hypothetical protein
MSGEEFDTAANQLFASFIQRPSFSSRGNDGSRCRSTSLVAGGTAR